MPFLSPTSSVKAPKVKMNKKISFIIKKVCMKTDKLRLKKQWKMWQTDTCTAVIYSPVIYDGLSQQELQFGWSSPDNKEWVRRVWPIRSLRFGSPNFNKYQLAYHPGCSTETALQLLLDQIYSTSDEGKHMLLVSLDLNVAFHMVGTFVALNGGNG